MSKININHIPSYNTHLFREKHSNFAVIIPVINEGVRIQNQLNKMRSLALEFDVIIADGGSTDSSLGVDFLKHNNIRALLIKTGAGKLSAQMRMAFAFCRDQKYEGVILLDGNDKDNPNFIPQFARFLEKGYDHIQGSRFLPGGFHKNTPLFRYLSIKLIHAPLISWSARFRYTDTTNGFRAYSMRLLSDPRLNIYREVFSHYELHYYLAIRASRLKFKCIEIPVERVYPSSGPAPTKIKGIRGNFTILRTLLAAVFGFYN